MIRCPYVLWARLEAHTMARPPNITQLLLAWRDGDQAALDALMPLVPSQHGVR